MEERKCFGCGGFRHIIYQCRNMRREELVQISSNKFEVLKNNIIQRGEESEREIVKDKRKILREEGAKKGIEV